MKTLSVLVLAVMITSCLPGGGKSKDKKETPLEKVGKASLKEATLNEFSFAVNEEKLEKNEIPYGCKVVLTMKGAEGFKEVKGKINCNASVKIFNSKNEEIVNLDNLYKEEFPNGIPVERFNGELFLSLRCQTPIKLNEKYKFVFALKDLESKSTIEISENFSMVPTTGLVYEEKGLTSDGPFLYNSENADLALSTNKLKSGDTLYGYFSGVKGLIEKDGMVWPDASIKFLNDLGDEIADIPDLYKEYSKTGIAATEIKELIALHLMLPDNLKSGKKYSAIFYIGDKKDKNKSFTATYNFTIK